MPNTRIINYEQMQRNIKKLDGSIEKSKIILQYLTKINLPEDELLIKISKSKLLYEILFVQNLKNIINGIKDDTLLEKINNVAVDYMDLMANVSDGLVLTNADILKSNYDAIMGY
jgi:hypothetical protein